MTFSGGGRGGRRGRGGRGGRVERGGGGEGRSSISKTIRQVEALSWAHHLWPLIVSFHLFPIHLAFIRPCHFPPFAIAFHTTDRRILGKSMENPLSVYQRNEHMLNATIC